MPEGSRRRRITINVSEQEHAAWRVLAAREGISLAEWIRRASNRRVTHARRDGTLARLLDTLRSHELSWAGLVGCWGCHGICMQLLLPVL